MKKVTDTLIYMCKNRLLQMEHYFVLAQLQNPIYGLPKAAIGILAPWSPIIDLLPLFMAFVGVTTIVFTVLIWWKGYWRIMGRIHYTLFSAVTLGLLWIFVYWNLI